ncbi:MAG: NFYB/HAP3 family transcription factor subunit [Candidatus Bathyarchaeota archaeon]|nr:NFYB/HAP3 family transcription factor subunit [Candidatus Bathyarchaeota archaeon]
MKDCYLSNAAVHKLIQVAGAERIGDDAVEELRKVLEEIAINIGKDAIELSSHAGRRTVKLEDIRLSAKRIKLNLI